MIGLAFDKLPLFDEETHTENLKQGNWSQPSSSILKEINRKGQKTDEEYDQEEIPQESVPIIIEALSAFSTIKTFRY